MARICPSCGHENADDVDFCTSCGGYVRWEPTRVATPAVQAPPPEPPPTPPAPAAPPPAPAETPPAQAAPAPVQQAPPQRPAAPPAQAPPPPPAQPQQAPAPQQAPPPAPEPAEEEPRKRRWGRKQKIPGIQGGGISKPRVRGPRVSAPRVNVGPQGVNVSAPRVSGPRVAPPVAKAPRVKQPKIPTTPKGIMQAFKKAKLPGGGGSGGGGHSGAVSDGPIAPQPVETWQWDAVGRKSGRGKGVLVFLLLLLFAAAAAGAGWWFFVREDDDTAAAGSTSTATTESFVTGLQPLLVRSSRDRVRISRAVTGVAACSLAPGPAAQQVEQTIAGRRAVLRQVRRVATPNARIRGVRRLLERSLSLSLAAGRDYSRWIASFNGSCPARNGPAYARAIASNGRAQAAKAAFSRAYNPIARSVGARTWRSTQF